MSARTAAFRSGGIVENSTEVRASRARSDASYPCASRAAAYWSTKPVPNSSGSSAASTTGTPASSIGRSGTDSSPGAHSERDVGRRADPAGDPRIGECGQDRRLLGRPHPVTDAPRIELFDGAAHSRRTEELTRMWHSDEPVVPRDPER